MHTTPSQSQITPLGITDWRDVRQLFGIRDTDRLVHIGILGKSGSGKSTLMLNMAISDCRRGFGILFIDPHGDTAHALLDYIPHDRINDVVYIPGIGTANVSFNPLSNIPKQEHTIVVSALLTTFKKVWSESWGNRMEHILRYTLFALLEYPGATLLDISRFLTNDDFRMLVLRSVSNAQVVAFWFHEYAKYPAAFKQEAISPILNKFGIFSVNQTLKAVFGKAQSSFSLADVILQKKIVICNLAKGSIGEEASSLLGSILIAGLQSAAVRRHAANIQPFFLYVDELQNFVPASFIGLLGELRKFGIGVCLATQHLGGMSEAMQRDLFGNMGTLICFTVGSIDADLLAKEYTPVFSHGDLIALPKHRFYIKLRIDGQTSRPFSAKSLPRIQLGISFREEVIAFQEEAYYGLEPEPPPIPFIPQQKIFQSTLFG